MNTDSPNRWQRMAAIFDEVVKPSPERRDAFLESKCGDDGELRKRLVEMR